MWNDSQVMLHLLCYAFNVQSHPTYRQTDRLPDGWAHKQTDIQTDLSRVLLRRTKVTSRSEMQVAQLNFCHLSSKSNIYEITKSFAPILMQINWFSKWSVTSCCSTWIYSRCCHGFWPIALLSNKLQVKKLWSYASQKSMLKIVKTCWCKASQLSEAWRRFYIIHGRREPMGHR